MVDQLNCAIENQSFNELTITVPFEKICRGCLQTCNNMTLLFEGNMSEIFRACTSLDIVENDELPPYICDQCLHQINKWYTFKQLCIQSDDILRAHINENHMNNQAPVKSLNTDQSLDFNSTNLLEAEVIFANLPEDTSSRVAQKNAECIMQLTTQSDEDEGEQSLQNNITNYQAHQSNIDIEPECNLIPLQDDVVINVEIIWETKNDNAVQGNDNTSQQEFVVEDLLTLHKCDICTSIFPNNDDLSVHMSIHNNKKIQCNKCEKKFQKMCQLKRHIKTHLSVKNHQCGICSKEFTEAGALNKHKRLHINREKIECKICKKIYSSNCKLKLHHRRVHTNLHICYKCQKVFPSKDEMLEHRSTEHPKTFFTCDVCQKNFNHQSNLVDHKKIHSNYKPFRCERCNRNFTQKTNYEAHLRVHKGIRPFMCQICQRTFASAAKLRLHERTHTETFPKYVCMQCGKRFLRAEGLEMHKKLHSGEKLYPCTICPKRFVNANVRNRHLNIHSRAKIYHCMLCSELFDKYSELNAHRRQQHKPLRKRNKPPEFKNTNDVSMFSLISDSENMDFGKKLCNFDDILIRLNASELPNE